MTESKRISAVHRPFYISICISTLPMQHTTFKAYIYSAIYRHVIILVRLTLCRVCGN